ncbi:hypothetical protein QBC34DRAFT_103441 [Podospora aff. communis PSN243]|uniref:DUF6590 domain-containing protein n=1 Tax=Podospora aff. communis PSN243 TaxID=3040156 RepID=A0AAV9H763_9PEZI|nr:hypothetical protein QBC34DRAFT_103441 [Podospora aff. communis PSN243]
MSDFMNPIEAKGLGDTGSDMDCPGSPSFRWSTPSGCPSPRLAPGDAAMQLDHPLRAAWAMGREKLSEALNTLAATAKGKNLETEPPIPSLADIPGDIGASERLDDEYVVADPVKFKPGEVFKVLWCEPKPDKANPRVAEAGSPDKQHSIEVRRFVVVANDEGHCTPINTYDGRGCTKKGVKARKHGVVYMAGEKPKMLRGEPQLGFRPVRMLSDCPTETLRPESRIHYSRFTTIEHDIRVSFVGRIMAEDMQIVNDAVDMAWSCTRSRKRGRGAESRPKKL